MLDKKILFFISILFLIAISCSKSDNEVAIEQEYIYQRLWALTACGSDFDYMESSPEAWSNKVLEILLNKGFIIESDMLGFIEQEPFIGCGNCRLTGDILDVAVPVDQREDLANLGFGD